MIPKRSLWMQFPEKVALSQTKTAIVMKKTIMILVAAVTMLTSCHTAENSLSQDYDERPLNKQPVLERPAWPNYDLHNDRSFAAFSHIQTAPLDKVGTYLHHYVESGWTARCTLHRCKDATYLCLDYTIPQQQDWFFWRFTTGSAIIDADTGDRYLLQRVEHFPMDQCYWTYGQSNETIRFVEVYPPLPLSVKRVQLYEASAESRRWMDGTGVLTKPIKIDDLRPHSLLKYKSHKRGRIIR